MATVAIGERRFDGDKDVFCSCGTGGGGVAGRAQVTLTETLKTRARSRTMALDPKTHRLFVPAADFKPPAGQPNGRPVMVPKTFCVQIYAK